MPFEFVVALRRSRHLDRMRNTATSLAGAPVNRCRDQRPAVRLLETQFGSATTIFASMSRSTTPRETQVSVMF
jgi:hypothetical protein